VFETDAEARAHFPVLGSSGFIPLRYRPGGLCTWSGHLPFARDLVESLWPSMIVELGTHYGESYFGFCQSVAEIGADTKCYAVDTWRGDPHAGEYGSEVYQEVDRYNSERYRSFSYLLPSTFDDALTKFTDGSIDLLHIDGLHTYGAVGHDWRAWLPKVAPGGIILLHDIAVRHADFGVWKLWEEISHEYESFEFHHSFGLGVLRKPGPRTARAGILDYLFVPENAVPLRRYYVLCAERLDARADLAHAKDPGREPLFQVYYPEGDCYSEQASFRAALIPGLWQKLVFELPQGIDGAALRLDPADRPAVIDIASVALFDACRARELWRCRGRGEDRSQFEVGGTAVPVPHDSYLEVFSYGSDPQVRVTVPEHIPRCEPLVLECWVRVHAGFSRFAERFQPKAQPGFLEHREPVDQGAPMYSAAPFPDEPVTAEDFAEEWYLATHPDVAQAVHEGRLASGWEHFLRFGRVERRRFRRK
jgi:hypothetical protein